MKRYLDPTRIGIDSGLIDPFERDIYGDYGMVFPELAEVDPVTAYYELADLYSSQPHDKPDMPELGLYPHLEVLKVTRITGVRGLFRAIRGEPINLLETYAFLDFTSPDDGNREPGTHPSNVVSLADWSNQRGLYIPPNDEALSA